MTKDIEALWTAHEQTPFPDGHRSVSAQGMKLTLLESEIAGYILTFITTKGGIGSRQRNVLEDYSKKLVDIIAELETEEAKNYFASLKKITDLVLEKAHDQPR